MVKSIASVATIICYFIFAPGALSFVDITGAMSYIREKLVIDYFHINFSTSQVCILISSYWQGSKTFLMEFNMERTWLTIPYVLLNARVYYPPRKSNSNIMDEIKHFEGGIHEYIRKVKRKR